MLHEGEDGRAGQSYDDGDGERRRRKIEFTTREISQTRCSPYDSFDVLAQGVGTYLLGEKLPTSTSTRNMILIDVAPSTFTNRPK